MTCCEFERKLNELIDSEGEAALRAPAVVATGSMPLATELERAVIDHASRCSACREVAARYQILRRALYAWNSPPIAPAGLADRILAAAADASVPASSACAIIMEGKRKRLRLVVLTAVAVAAAAGLGLPVIKSLIEHDLLNRPMQPATSVGPAGALVTVGGSSSTRQSGARVLNDALAEATSATLDLARSASEPAARFSRQMLDTAIGPQARTPDSAYLAGDAEVRVTMPTLKSLAPDPSAAGAVLQEVGNGLVSRVVPLSQTARHAFRFLLGPAPPKADSRNNTPAARGA
jgi:hypothetical protein